MTAYVVFDADQYDLAIRGGATMELLCTAIHAESEEEAVRKHILLNPKEGRARVKIMELNAVSAGGSFMRRSPVVEEVTVGTFNPTE